MADSTEQDRRPHADHAPSPGGRLRAARERKGLTLVEAADALRLDHWLVEALERDDFSALGAPVFVKGHLRKYAALTGEPADDILLAYHQRAGVQEVPPLLDRAALLRSASGPSRGMPVAALLGVLLFGGAVGAWWWYEQPVERPTPVGALAAASVEAEPEPGLPATAETSVPTTEPRFDLSADAASASPTPALRPATTLSAPPATNGSATGGAGDAASAPVAGSTLGGTSSSAAASAGTGLSTTSASGANGTVPPPAASAVPGSSTSSDAGATPPATGAGATPAASPSPLESLSAGANTAQRPEAVPAPATLRAGEHILVLSFTGDSWAEVHDGAGARLYYDLGQAGSRRALRGMPPFQIVLGHYAGVSIEMDGQPRAIPAEAVRGNTARFTLDPT